MKIIVINDIHSNFAALSAFSELVDSYQFDKLIILGDLLTYGVKVNETLNLLKSLSCRYDCVFVKGNHDQIYFDYQNGANYEYKPFPEFIKESVEYTYSLLDLKLECFFDWRDNCEFGGVYFAHANSFEYGDWSYLNSADDFDRNIFNLSFLGCSVGVFAHSHRSKYKKDSSRDLSVKNLISDGMGVSVSKSERAVFTNGSLGQPRNSLSSFLLCEIKADEVVIKSVNIEYDVETHKDSIFESNLTADTKNKLLSFYI